MLKMALSGPSYVLYLEDHCPPDSTSVNGICKCNTELCPVPSCDKFLTIVRNGTDNPGNCCPVYTCDNCTLDADNNENCTCGEGAFLNDKGDCECIDLHKTLVNNICQCDKSKCELPKLCDNNTVRVEDGKEGCCVKIACRPCPPDTYPTEYQGDEIENKCICFACPETQCNETHVPHILRRGRNIPPQCCDLYKCIPKDTLQDAECVANDHIYTNGQWWITDDKQNCTCSNGVSVCDEPLATDILVKNCFHNDTSYPHLATWTEDECTNCTCYDGVPKCIAHFCNVTVTRVMKYEECLQHVTMVFPSVLHTSVMLVESVVEKHPLLDVYMRKHNLSENDTLELLTRKTNTKDESAGTVTSLGGTPGQNKGNAALPYIIPILTFVAGAIVGYILTIFCKRKCTFKYSPVTKPVDNNNLPQENIKYISEKSPLKT
ncbi:hypothetical protein QE152_g10418 [Popillia japonica]|uniref:VWFC domain-containing protein n=1 Tax=Popillia japonica TaxID=7064 RepID=A0AAW1LRH6_POPJA